MKKTAQDYADELLKLYREKGSKQEAVQQPQTKAVPTVAPAEMPPEVLDGSGGLLVNVTTLRGLYPVEGALVTVFTGTRDNMQIVEIDTTDQSGKSKTFAFSAPPRAESQQESSNKTPYSSYNVSVRSDGFIEQVAMNVPIFSGVVSMQSIDLVKNTVAGKNTEPQIIEGGTNYNL
ncbi:MAG: hypothetical protein Q4B40_00470 [Clostridia bacterium]|nr:hypothetical protein [Clostridia bacterium]